MTKTIVGLHRNDARPRIADCDRLTVGENNFCGFRAARDAESAIADRHCPGEGILAFQTDARCGVDRHAQGLQEESERRETCQRVALADGRACFGVVALVEGARLFKILHDRGHDVFHQTRGLGVESVGEQSLADELVEG